MRFNLSILVPTLLLTSTLVFGGMIVQVQVIEEKSAPATQPTTAAVAPEVLVSVEARAESAGEFFARTQTTKQTIKLKGKITPHQDKYTCRVEFDEREKLGVGIGGRHIGTTVRVGLNESLTIGGVGQPGEPPRMKVVLTLKPEKQATGQ